MLTALVTDGHSRAAVAGVRALGRAGIPVLTLSHTRVPPAAWSRYASGRHHGPPSDHEAAWVTRVAEVALEHGPLVVFPGQEQAVGALARHTAALPEAARFPYLDPQAVLALSDKGQMAALAAGADLAPPTILATGTAGALAAAPPPTPCVVKTPALSDALPATRICETREELVALLESLPESEPLIVQERAVGTLDALSLVLERDGGVAACFASRALRLSPADAGASSLSVSVAPDPDLVERALQLLRGLGWSGLAHMQVLRTARGPALIDVNVRFYGSLPLATAAGVNLPAIWHRVASGAPPEPAPRYRLGVRYRWMQGEVAAALRGEPRRLLTGPARATSGAMWTSDDPVPGALLGAQVALTYAGSALRRAARLRRPAAGSDGA